MVYLGLCNDEPSSWDVICTQVAWEGGVSQQSSKGNIAHEIDLVQHPHKTIREDVCVGLMYTRSTWQILLQCAQMEGLYLATLLPCPFLSVGFPL